MLRNVVARTFWMSNVHAGKIGFREIAAKTSPVDIASKLNLARVSEQCRPLHTTMANQLKRERTDRRKILSSVLKKDEGTMGEKGIDIDPDLKTSGVMFPDENTPNLLFDGVRFDELPILHVKVTYTNTIMTVTDHEGSILLIHSCGSEGFKNSRKSSSVAAQATGISLAKRALRQGLSNVRVKVNGLGPGRSAGLQGVTMGGLKVVAISDDTFINWHNSPRPKKARKL